MFLDLLKPNFASNHSPKFKMLHPSVNSRFKRLLDVGGSIIGLLFLAIIFIPVAFAIKLDTPGSIFYCQERVGLAGNRFTMYKFRTMIDGANELKGLVTNEAQGLIFKNRKDPRVTKVGRFLRRTSLDEFPQFWNVLTGNMSLVGTRPPTLDEVAHYSENHWQRLLVKPGITGEWQVNGRSTIENFEQILDLDLRYQKFWTPSYDIVIIWKTLFVLLTRTGAY